MISLSFADTLQRIDVGQSDDVGLEPQMLDWLPFGRIKPGAIYFEVAHMADIEKRKAENKMSVLGYRIIPTESKDDAVAIAL